MFNPNDEYKDYSLAELAEFTKKIDEIPITDEIPIIDEIPITSEELNRRISEALGGFTKAVCEACAVITEELSRIDWNALLEAMQEVQKNAGDSDNSDNLHNIGDDLMDQQREAEE